MSNNKKNAITIILVISSLIPLKTSAMQQDSLTPSQAQIIKINKITLKTLETLSKFFTHHYEILLKFYNKEPFIKNIKIEEYQNELEKEEKKYHLFFENIKDRYDEEYQNFNSKIINTIYKIKKIIKKIKTSDKSKKRITKNNTIENMINLLNEKINKIDEQTKKTENKIKEYNLYNKENIDNINNNIKKEIENIETDTKKKIINFSKLEEYKKTFSEYNKNLNKKQQDINKIKNKIEEYKSFFETISKEDNKIYNKINSEIKYILNPIFDLIKLDEYKEIFSEHYKKFPLKKDDELFIVYYKNNEKKIFEIIEGINNKIKEYNSFIEKIKNKYSEQYNKLIKEINNILSNSVEPNITFFKILKNTKMVTEIYEIEKKLFDLENTIKDIEKLFTKIFTDKTNIQKLETKDLFDKKLNFIEQNFKPVITSYEEYMKEIKEKCKKEPYLLIYKKIFYNYNLFGTNITTNLMAALNSLYNIYNKIEKNLNENEKENYKNRLKTIITILSNNDDEYDDELDLNIEAATDSMSDTFIL